MKRILILAVLMTLSCSASAIVAPRKPFTYTQPDGTVITLLRHGDESGHWTTSDGVRVAKDADGFYRPVSPAAVVTASVSRPAKRLARHPATLERQRRSRLSFGSNHFLVILIEFSDLSFTVSDPGQAFTDLLMQRGYSDNGATGSALDFYYDNSDGRFNPIYDVYGPVKLSKKHAYYGGNTGSGDDAEDQAPEEALYDACVLLDGSVDFSRYDHDGDGIVDNIFFFYAGYNEAEGGSEDTIWPHQWDMQYSSFANKTFDGVRLGSYACTSEYKGYTGRQMCGVGTFCHEFGHVLGLPDFYDTDYETNGETEALYDYSTMCSGAYNNDGRTPPYFNAVERAMLGWMDEPVTLAASGPVVLPAITANVAYKSLTDTDGEYFVYECRDGSGWDSPLQPGLIAYHVDQSARKVSVSVYSNGRYVTRSISAKELWDKWEETNAINSNGSHPCFYIVPAGKASRRSSGTGYLPFPGTDVVTTFAPNDWDGDKTGDTFSAIAFSGGQVTMTASIDAARHAGDGELTLATMGYASIQDLGNGVYEAGAAFPLILLPAETGSPRSTAWYYDEVPVTGESLPLSATGTHTVEARLTYGDGHTEVLELEITVR